MKATLGSPIAIFPFVSSSLTMKLLIIASNYPHQGHPYSGIFNERSVNVLSKLCERVDVVSPSPYVPSILARLVPKWKAYAGAIDEENRDGIAIHRPLYPQIPRLWPRVWNDQAAFACSLPRIKTIHREVSFDALLSFDLFGTGIMGWRIGKALNIPAVAWVTGRIHPNWETP